MSEVTKKLVDMCLSFVSDEDLYFDGQYHNVSDVTRTYIAQLEQRVKVLEALSKSSIEQFNDCYDCFDDGDQWHSRELNEHVKSLKAALAQGEK